MQAGDPPLFFLTRQSSTGCGVCATGDSVDAGCTVRLKQVARLLAQYAHRLPSRSAKKKASENVRELLAQAADAIRADATTLGATLHCPDGT